MRRFIAILYFLMLVNDGVAKSGTYIAVYGKYLWTPTLWVQAVLFDPLLMTRLYDICMAIALFVGLGSRDGKGARVEPMKSTLLLATGTTFAWFALGMVRGGDARGAAWQIYLPLAAILSSFALAANFRTAEHYRVLAKAFVLAGFYRALMCLVFYIGWVRGMPGDLAPPTLTTHDDSVLWVTTIMLLVTNAVLLPTRRSLWTALLGIPWLLVAIQLNNRRLAWVSLGGGLVTFYALLRADHVKRRITRMLLWAAPLVVAYVVIGWGRGGKLFKPLSAFASVSTVEDASTKARNVENLSLIFTAHAHGWLLGSGWGQKYVELSNKYTIASAFELWQYVPHNSILGVFAYTGALGFIGFWLRMPTAIFALARTARLGSSPIDRAVGVACVVTAVVCFNQMFGDMGLFSPVTQYTLAVVFGAALRVPIEANAWVQRRPRAAAPLAA